MTKPFQLPFVHSTAAHLLAGALLFSSPCRGWLRLLGTALPSGSGQEAEDGCPGLQTTQDSSNLITDRKSRLFLFEIVSPAVCLSKYDDDGPLFLHKSLP